MVELEESEISGKPVKKGIRLKLTGRKVADDFQLDFEVVENSQRMWSYDVKIQALCDAEYDYAVEPDMMYEWVLNAVNGGIFEINSSGDTAFLDAHIDLEQEGINTHVRVPPEEGSMTPHDLQVQDGDKESTQPSEDFPVAEPLSGPEVQENESSAREVDSLKAKVHQQQQDIDDLKTQVGDLRARLDAIDGGVSTPPAPAKGKSGASKAVGHGNDGADDASEDDEKDLTVGQAKVVKSKKPTTGGSKFSKKARRI